MAGAGKILLVEDEPNIGNAMRLMLKRVGFEVENVSSGREALAWLDRMSGNGKANLALMMSDYHLSDITGLDVFQHAKTLGFSAPQLLISGDEQDDAVKEWRRQPRRSFLGKPFAINDLLKAVKRAIEENDE